MRTEELRKTKILERSLQSVSCLIKRADELKRDHSLKREERAEKAKAVLGEINFVLQAIEPLKDSFYELVDKRDDLSQLVERASKEPSVAVL